MPAFDEGPRIANSVTALATFLAEKGIDHEIIVVDDGSSDQTAEIAGQTGARVLRHPQNLGKGAALRTGIQHATGNSVVFTDADLAYPPELVIDLLEVLEAGADVAVGDRHHKQSRSTAPRSKLRSIGGNTISLLIRLLLLPAVVDTQAGIKGFKQSTAKLLFGHSRMDGFAIDVELFVMADRNSLRLVGVPVVVDYRAGSSIGVVGDTTRFVKDLLRIRRLAKAGAYDFVHEVADLRTPRHEVSQQRNKPTPKSRPGRRHSKEDSPGSSRSAR